ncbi:glycosyltransferase family 2 protein [Dictyobacter arantiisoli]|uniref:Glycosyltransferase 2-like domain-containing protein n=1 Tax=Dictyobacter arantiisoli TaxID=2014874 RepID=A0A5A5T8J7_9CHLR|nr:glycosyltransferase family 2 protein [Dictyobacter arantiisoli]GCF07800.1 hypothetical protein KDI_13640 [Dictyobacter arantiisoli]
MRQRHFFSGSLNEVPGAFSCYAVLWKALASLGMTIGVVALSAMDAHPIQVGVLPEQEVELPPASAEKTPLVHSISVVLPAYNEEAVIEHTLSVVVSALKNWTHDFEIVLVNDGSKDRTRTLVEHTVQVEPRIRLINHPANKGYGAALVTGFHAVSKDLVFFMDSDGQFDIRDLEQFFPLLEDHDAVLGYRNPRHDPWIRKLNAWGWKQLVRLVFGVQVRDLDCAFKLYRAEFFQTLDLETGGAMINAEIMYKFKRAGYSYTEVGVKHLPRAGGEATGAKPQVILRALYELCIFARKWKKEERLRTSRHTSLPK